MKRRIVAACGLSVVLFAAVASRAMIEIEEHGSWPSDWPKALEPLRDHARTLCVANGTQEDIYEITFSDRAEFEKVWPSLLSLRLPVLH